MVARIWQPCGPIDNLAVFKESKQGEPVQRSVSAQFMIVYRCTGPRISTDSPTITNPYVGYAQKSDTMPKSIGNVRLNIPSTKRK